LSIFSGFFVFQNRIEKGGFIIELLDGIDIFY